MKKRINRALAVVILIVCAATRVSAAEIFTEDATFLVRSVAAEYADLSYAERVGVIAVILNRSNAEGYPKTAAGVIATYRNEDGSLRFTGKVQRADEGVWRMTKDAYLAVLSGADVTDGALNFEVIELPVRKLDLDFNDRSEAEYALEVSRMCEKYKLVVGSVGFW